MEEPIFRSIWNQELFITFLLWALAIIAALIAFLILILIGWRGYLVLKEQNEEKRDEKNLSILLTYLDEEIGINKIHSYLKGDPKKVSGFIEICIDLMKDLQGQSKEKIQQLLSVDLIQQIYSKKLKTGSLDEISEALIFFRHAEVYKEETKELIFSVLPHKNAEIAFAAALVLIKTEQYDIKFKVLKMMSNRNDIVPASILELLSGIKEAGNRRDEQLESMFMKLIKDDQIPAKNRIIIIRFIGEVKLYSIAPQLYHLLLFYLKDRNHQTKERMISALIEALGELQYRKVLRSIENLIDISNTIIKIGCVRALGSLAEKKSIKLLHIFFNDSEEDIRFEAMRQLLRVDQQNLAIYDDINGKSLTAVEQNTLQEMREIKQYRYA